MRTRHKRAFVEFCCGSNSVLGAKAPDDTFVVRLTEKEDLTTSAGLRFATGWIKHLGPRMPGLLWCSIPCTGGSRRNDMNPARHTEKFQKNLRAKRAYARSLWKNFEKTAEIALRFGWGIAIEWPNACSYWKWLVVTRFLDRHGFQKAYCRRCAVVLKDDALRCRLLSERRARQLTILMWTVAILGGVIMNLNFSLYLLAPAVVDIATQL